jgi:hypothetical protein
MWQASHEPRPRGRGITIFEGISLNRFCFKPRLNGVDNLNQDMKKLTGKQFKQIADSIPDFHDERYRHRDLVMIPIMPEMSVLNRDVAPDCRSIMDDLILRRGRYDWDIELDVPQFTHHELCIIADALIQMTNPPQKLINKLIQLVDIEDKRGFATA